MICEKCKKEMKILRIQKLTICDCGVKVLEKGSNFMYTYYCFDCDKKFHLEELVDESKDVYCPHCGQTDEVSISSKHLKEVVSKFKKYEQVEFLPGSTIDHVVNELLSYQEKGKLAVAKFNGVILYSDIVTLDSAYREITGKTKTEFDDYLG